MRSARGAALVDVLAAASLSVILAGIAVPTIGGALDRERAIVGAQHLAGQLQRARLESLKRGTSVALRLAVADDGRTEMRLFVDRNGNGVSQRDIDRGLDLPLGAGAWLDQHARDVSLRINQVVDDIGGAGQLAPGDDPLRIGSSAFVAFSPVGGATSGTMFIAARRGPQMAVRVFGATGRIRVLTFDASARQWRS